MFYQNAEKFINDRFFKESHDGVRSNINMQDVIHDKLTQDEKNKDPEYYNNRLGVVHASGLYGCQRGQLLQMLCIDQPVKSEKEEQDARRTLGIFKAGNLFEKFIVDAIPGAEDRQTEYSLPYGDIVLTGRSDFFMAEANAASPDEFVRRIGEVKSVNSNAFWYRKKEGTLVQWHNQIQLQVYMWLERILNDNYYDGYFVYVSKDDCTISGTPVKFDPHMIDDVVKPILDALNAAFIRNRHLAEEYQVLKSNLSEGADVPADAHEAEQRDIREKMQNVISRIDFTGLDAPDLAVFNSTKQAYVKNFINDYCEYHNICAGSGWLALSSDEIKRKNKEFKLRQFK